MEKRWDIYFVTVAFFLTILSCGPDTEKIQISPAIRYQGNILYIKNADKVVYDSVKVQINGSFKNTLPLSIPCGDEAQYELSSFTKDDGERFNIVKYRLREITITCEVSDLRGNQWVKLGRAFYHGNFN